MVNYSSSFLADFNSGCHLIVFELFIANSGELGSHRRFSMILAVEQPQDMKKLHSCFRKHSNRKLRGWPDGQGLRLRVCSLLGSQVRNLQVLSTLLDPFYTQLCSRLN